MSSQQDTTSSTYNFTLSTYNPMLIRADSLNRCAPVDFGATGGDVGELFIACESGDTQSILEQLQSGHKLEAQDAYAIGSSCDLEFIQQVATDMFSEYFKGACYAGKTDSANYLLDKAAVDSGSSIESVVSENAFMSCCHRGMNSVIERIAHLFPPGSMRHGLSPVIAAGVDGHLETVKLLVNMGYDRSLGVYQEIINQEIKDYINSLSE